MGGGGVRRGCCILWRVWSRQEKNHNHLYSLIKNTACWRNMSLCRLSLWTQLHNRHTFHDASNCTDGEASSPQINLFSARSGTRWLIFCHVKVDRSADKFHRSVQAFMSVPSHLLRSAADLVFQGCKCSVFLSPIHRGREGNCTRYFVYPSPFQVGSWRGPSLCDWQDAHWHTSVFFWSHTHTQHCWVYIILINLLKLLEVLSLLSFLAVHDKFR